MFKTRPLEDLVSPPKKPPISPLSPSLCLSLSLSQSLFSLSLPLSLSRPSLFLYLYPSPVAVSPTTIMDLTARCLLLLSCLGAILAIDLEAIDPGYYVEPTATSEAIDYKDPCKAGEIFPFFFFTAATLCDLPYLCGGRNMPRICLWIGQRDAFREMTAVAVVFKRLVRTLFAFVLH